MLLRGCMSLAIWIKCKYNRDFEVESRTMSVSNEYFIYSELRERGIHPWDIIELQVNRGKGYRVEFVRGEQ